MVAADPEWRDLAGLAGHEVRALGELTGSQLRGAAAIVVGRAGAWDRIRSWRAAGVPVGVVVVVTDGEDPPDDRPRLEPVVLLRRTDGAGLREALERLAVGEAPARVSLASGVADFHRQVFERHDGAVVPLTGLESRLLAYLAARSFRVVGRDELQEQVWGYRKGLATKAVEMTIARLRRKVAQDALVTVRGEGYRAVRPAEATAPSAPLAALRAAARALAHQGRAEAAALLLDRHDAERAAGDDRALAESRLLRARLAGGEEPTGALAHAEDAARLAERWGWPDLSAEACCAAGEALLALDRRDEAAARALRAEGLAADAGLRARALALAAHAAPDGPGRWDRALEALAALDGDPDAVERRAVVRTRRGEDHARAGRVAEAAADWAAAATDWDTLGRPSASSALRGRAAGLGAPGPAP